MSEGVSLPLRPTGRPEEPSRIAIYDERNERIAEPKINAQNEYIFNYKPAGDQREYALLDLDRKKVFAELPVVADDYHVGFYPEGGSLIDGNTVAVGFKATGRDGLGRTVEGKVFDVEGNLVTAFATLYKGIGLFSIRPERGKKYYAECTDENGITQRFDLPPVADSGYGIKGVSSGNSLLVTALRAPSSPEQTLYLLAHCRGTFLHSAPVQPGVEAVRFDFDSLPAGVIHFVLLDPQRRVLSERLVFSRSEGTPGVAVKTDKEVYGSREKIVAELRLDGKVAGYGNRSSLSVSVTDAADGATDTTSNIYTWLLLESDLRGFIEEPAYYFENNDRIREIALNALMLTQGWRRYDLPATLAGDIQTPTEPLEIGQEISGTVYGLMGKKPVKGAQVMIISPNAGYFDQTVTDEEGRFSFNDREHPDSTFYMVQARNARGRTNLTLVMDESDLPEPSYSLPSFPARERSKAEEGYIAKAEQRASRTGDLRTIELEELKVVGSRYHPDSKMRSFADRVFEEEQLAKFPTLEQFFRSIGAFVQDNRLYMGNPMSNPPAVVIIDGMQYELFSEYSFIPAGEITLIEYSNSWTPLPGEYLPATSDGEDAVNFASARKPTFIRIVTKSGPYLPPAGDHMKVFGILGYQKPAEFYSPKYDNPAAKNDRKPDARTTIHWIPDLRTDESGRARFDFYTADENSDYQVTVEGVTDDGGVVYYREIIRRAKQ